MNVRKWDVDFSATVKMMKEQGAPKNKDKSFKDERFYYPKLKEDGTAAAEIRFLPQKDEKALPILKRLKHEFKGPGGWFINECPRTIREKCPVCEAIDPLWETDRKLASVRGKKTEYVANILVIKDPQCRENEGKVFLFKFGQSIYKKIMAKLSPAADDVADGLDEVVVVFHPHDGANFKFKIKTTETADDTGKKRHYPNYDTSEWCAPSSLTDEQIDTVKEHLYDLNEFLDPKRFKKYKDLEDRYLKVIGSTVSQGDVSAENDVAGGPAPESDDRLISSPETEEAFWNNVKPKDA